MKNINFTIKPTFKEILGFQYTILIKRLFKRDILIVLFIVSLAIEVLNGLAQGIDLVSFLGNGIFTFVLLYCVILLLIVTITFFISKKSFTSQKAYQEGILCTLDTKGIKMKSINSSSNTSYKDIYIIQEYKKVLSIYLAPKIVFIIPKSCINGQLGNIKKLLSKYIPHEKLLFKK